MNDENCARCGKLIFATDIKRAIGKAFHSWCFRCVACSATVQLGKEKTFNKELYCSKCHLATAAGATGFRGAGSSIDAHVRPTNVHSTVETPAAAVPLNIAAASASAAPTASAGQLKVCSDCNQSGAGRFCSGCGSAL
jgi:hypothetical protein